MEICIKGDLTNVISITNTKSNLKRSLTITYDYDAERYEITGSWSSNEFEQYLGQIPLNVPFYRVEGITDILETYFKYYSVLSDEVSVHKGVKDTGLCADLDYLIEDR